LKAEIASSFPDAEIELIEGDHGIFEIRKNGVLLFSKYERDRFPRPGEIVKLLK
jgi:selT/selW/selH-like putative selenoprotein